MAWGHRALPDSLPPTRRMPLHARTIARAYTTQLRQPVFMAYTAAGGLVLGAFFAYISGSAFVFTGHFGLDARQFSYVFVGNSIALVAAGVLGIALLKRGASAGRLMAAGLTVFTGAGTALVLVADAAAASLPLYTALLALAIGAPGLVFGNLTGLTMDQADAQAGVASALMGMLQYLMSALIGVGAA